MLNILKIFFYQNWIVLLLVSKTVSCSDKPPCNYYLTQEKSKVGDMDNYWATYRLIHAMKLLVDSCADVNITS